VKSGSVAEHAALLALLQAQPENLSWPARLRGIQPAPPAFFAAGDVVADDIAVSVVGSREASARGIEIARELARVLVARKVTVVSGLAPGIDTAAHRAALNAGGRTVAVIGTCIDRTYPTENRDLRAEIAARGLLLSQFWSNAPAQRQSFLMRKLRCPATVWRPWW
jgi:DNA processing protein